MLNPGNEPAIRKFLAFPTSNGKSRRGNFEHPWRNERVPHPVETRGGEILGSFLRSAKWWCVITPPQERFGVNRHLRPHQRGQKQYPSPGRCFRVCGQLIAFSGLGDIAEVP